MVEMIRVNVTIPGPLYILAKADGVVFSHVLAIALAEMYDVPAFGNKELQRKKMLEAAAVIKEQYITSQEMILAEMKEKEKEKQFQKNLPQYRDEIIRDAVMPDLNRWVKIHPLIHAGNGEYENLAQELSEKHDLEIKYKDVSDAVKKIALENGRDLDMEAIRMRR